ncbi:MULTISPECIES: 2-amino-4-hydroxy-6-hydroxymethyldihydropteridine diphosphokinase [Gardnerella]|nr:MULTISPECIES: 2-amino-4-hydroxy-6-hydroxymethyldihydropteridine diphosphokinase [Gardnerella]PNP89928.1 2-amino-4-hydroxy-6-hydroxymethyldihydropteridine diphosphokinase [Gardnerella sp. KA00735]
MSSLVYVSAGSNMGDRLKNLQQAVSMLKEDSHISGVVVSSVYETEPVGDIEQDSFYNIGLKFRTDLTPYELLDFIHEIEQRLHRKRIIRWGPRTIDLDIIDYDRCVFESENLTIPHKERDNRKFVIIPLLEISKDDPEYHELLEEKLSYINDSHWIKIVKSSEVFN